jgi:integrase
MTPPPITKLHTYPKGTPAGFYKRKFIACDQGDAAGVMKADPEAPWYFKFKLKGRQYPHCCNTNQIAQAKREAKAWEEKVRGAVQSGNWGEVDQAKLRSEIADVRELCEKYEGWDTQKPRKKTRKQNVDRFRQVLRVGMPGRAIDAVKLNEVTAEVLRSFVDKQKARAGKSYQRYEGSEERELNANGLRKSIASTVTQARSLFSKKALSFYKEKGLKVPEMSGFMSYYVEKPEIELPEAPELASVHALLASGPELRAQNSAAFLGLLLIAELGMRPIEILAAREWWLAKDGNTWVMSIIRRPQEKFDPKGNQGHMAVSQQLVDELERWKAQRTEGYLIPGKTVTQRDDAIRRDLSAWCGGFITDREKATYELRRYAGSRVLDVTGNLVDVQRFLRHKDIQTTMRWYAYRMQRAAALPLAVKIA